MGKATQLPFLPREVTACKPLVLLHMDVWGPSPVPAIIGHKFYLAIVDDYPRYTCSSICFKSLMLFKSYVYFINKLKTFSQPKIKSYKWTVVENLLEKLSLHTFKLMVYHIDLLSHILPNRMGLLSTKIVISRPLVIACLYSPNSQPNFGLMLSSLRYFKIRP